MIVGYTVTEIKILYTLTNVYNVYTLFSLATNATSSIKYEHPVLAVVSQHVRSQLIQKYLCSAPSNNPQEQ